VSFRFGFCGGAYESESAHADKQECINLYPERDESGAGKSPVRLMATPGLVEFGELDDAPLRGLFTGEDRCFAAAGETLYEVFSDGSFDDIGAIDDDASHSPVQIFPNGLELFVVSAGEAYVHNGVTLASAPVPADDDADPMTPAGTVGTARTGAYLDGYFIAAKPDSRMFAFSDLLTGLTWNAAEIAYKQGYPDSIRSILADHKELWLFGSHKSIEVWRNEGDPDEAGGFRPDPGAFQHQALRATFTPLSIGGSVAYLGGDVTGGPIAFITQGFTSVRVSTIALETRWAGYSTVADAISYGYTEDGHTFWVLVFPTANETWAYDLTTRIWHRRGYWNGSSWDMHRGRCYTYAFGKHLVGDHTTGQIYQMSKSLFDDDGDPIRRRRRAPHISADGAMVTHSVLTLDCEITANQLPEYELSWSDDNGANFTTPRTAVPPSAGKHVMIPWRRLGSSRDRLYNLETEAASLVVINDALLNWPG
jgi:hypothetical protein